MLHPGRNSIFKSCEMSKWVFRSCLAARYYLGNGQLKPDFDASMVQMRIIPGYPCSLGKAAGPSVIVVEMIRQGVTCATMIHGLATGIICDGKIPTDW